MRRFLSCVLAFLLVLTLMPAVPLTAQAASSGVYTYEVSNGGATITDYHGSGFDVVIPSTLRGYPVVSIGDGAFSDCTSLTSIKIPDSVKTIGDSAFYDCTRLTSIKIPDSVETIGDRAFYHCTALTSVTLGRGVISIGKSAFLDCERLTSITIPDSVETIGGYAFGCCTALTSVTIGRGVIAIGDLGFSFCSNIERVHIPDVSTWLNISFEKANANPLHSHYLYCDNCDYSHCDYSHGLYVDGEPLREAVIPVGTTTIPELSFTCCGSLKTVFIPSSVTSIGLDAFYLCNNITEVWYGGDRSQKESLLAQAEYGNSRLESSVVTWHFNTCEQNSHIYSDSCDTTCNSCDWERTINHTYDNACDSICNICSFARVIWHTYDNTCDTVCNVCSLERTIEHRYSNACDTTCNVCGAVRSVPDHVYSNSCDTTCNICGNVRTITHTYDDANDLICNVCKNTLAPGQPTLESRTATSVTLTAIAGYEYRKDNASWQSSNVFTGLSPASEYSFYQRVAASSENFVSPASQPLAVKTDKQTTSAPAAPTLDSVTYSSVSLISVAGCEYSIDGENWKTSPYFYNLTPNTQYTFYQRLAETSTSHASPKSSGLRVTTKNLGKITYDANGGQNAPESTTKDISTQKPTHSEYTFAGWSTKPYGVVEYQAGDTYEGEADLSLYAVWSMTCYTCNGRGKVTETCSKCNGKGYYFKTVSSCCRSDYATHTTGIGQVYQCRRCGEYCSLSNTQISCSTTTTDICSTCGGDIKIRTPHAVTPSPTAANITNESITLVLQPDMEYSKNGTNWQASPEFTGLEPGTVYTFYQRYVSNANHTVAEALCPALIVSTMPSMPKPSAPIVSSYTDTKVTLMPLSGGEYSMDGVTWQSSNVFTGLTPATKYTFYQRYAATEDLWPSSVSNSTTVTTDKAIQNAVPPVPAVATVTTTSVTLVSVAGCEYSINGTTWQTSPYFSGLSAAREYTFYQRYQATHNTHAGKSSEGLQVTTLKATQSRPSAPTLKSKTHNRVVLNSVSNCEYSKDGLNWQASPVFEGLDSSTTYLFYQRKCETGTSYASEMSNSLTVRTDDPPAYITGDLDGDGEITDWDGVLLARYLAGWLVEIAEPAALDIDNDGEVTDWDGVILDRYLAGWNVTIGKGKEE